jgi:hypothetical protein
VKNPYRTLSRGSPFQWIQSAFIRIFATPEAVAEESQHYSNLHNLDAHHNELNVIDYLYTRLNIIDSKAQSILTINTFALGALTITYQIGKSRQSQNLVTQHPNVSLALFAASTMALLLGFLLSRLRFDHITNSHNLDTYKCAFFKITIARQVILSIARIFTVTTFVMYGYLLVSSLWL